MSLETENIILPIVEEISSISLTMASRYWGLRNPFSVPTCMVNTRDAIGNEKTVFLPRKSILKHCNVWMMKKTESRMHL